MVQLQNVSTLKALPQYLLSIWTHVNMFSKILTEKTQLSSISFLAQTQTQFIHLSGKPFPWELREFAAQQGLSPLAQPLAASVQLHGMHRHRHQRHRAGRHGQGELCSGHAAKAQKEGDRQRQDDQ